MCSNAYECPAMPVAPCPPACPPAKKSNDPESKYYREIGTAMAGNQLIIRMEREKGKSKKSGDWSPPCDCDVVEIQRPTSKEGPKILKGPGNNRILFRVQSKTQVGKKEDHGHNPQGIYYEVGQCKEDRDKEDRCRTFTIYPVLDSPGSQEVHTDRITEGNESVFMVRVKKKPGVVEEPKKHIELELRTPKPPTQAPETLQPVVQQRAARADKMADASRISIQETTKKIAQKKKKKR
ncbi:uncharacterized protein LOC116431497 [Nomia melanderi]|uniref:uncharacterized protein LOC116431497 n=1 Tax=Nomia melanderi TaxID=2448451 RepID=UPI0013042CD4|nr:uncharacterized protein LOC116431497 [Nomia melanderi]